MNKQYEIDDAFLEEVKVVYTPPVKEPEIDNLFVDEAPATATKKYDLKRNGKELVKTDIDYVYRYLDGTGFACRIYHKESKKDTFVMYDPESKGQTDKNGKRLPPHPFRTKSQAAAHLYRELEKLNKDSTYKNHGVTFGQVWEMFLASPHERANETIRRYNSIYKHHVEKVFGERALNDIPAADYNEFFITMHESGDGKGSKQNGYSFEYVQSILKFVWLVVQYGYSKHVISTDHFIRFEKELKAPSRVKETDDKEIRVLTNEQIQKIKELLEPTDYYLPFIISLLGGLRPAETFALCFEDFDFKNNTVTINKQLVEETSGKRIIKFPKATKRTKKVVKPSIRTIEMPLVVMTEVRKRKKQLEEARLRDPLIFEQNKTKFIDGRNFKEEIIDQPNFINVDSKGRYINAHSFSYYTKIIKKNICPNEKGIEDFSFYTFRKTHLSNMASNNCPIGELMKRAGHGKVETLYESYYARTSSSEKKLIRAMNETASLIL